MNWKMDRGKMNIGRFFIMNHKAEIVGLEVHHKYGFSRQDKAVEVMHEIADKSTGSVLLEVRQNTPLNSPMILTEGLEREKFVERTHEDSNSGEITVETLKLDFDGKPILPSPYKLGKDGKERPRIIKAKPKKVLSPHWWHLLDTMRDMDRFYVYRRDDNMVLGFESAHNNGFFEVASAIEVGETLCNELNEVNACVGKLEQIGPMTWRWREIWAAQAVKETMTPGAYADGGTW